MKNQTSILSTKVLLPAQKQTLSEFYYVESDFIEVKPLPFSINKTSETAVFTSQNAVKSIADLTYFKEEIKDVYCVGAKTTELLTQLGKKVVFTAFSSKELALEILKREHKAVDFFCGTIRKNDLPEILKSNQVTVNEFIVYETIKVSQVINRNFEGILFYSPSAVQSYLLKNKENNSIAFCIGTSTGDEALKNFKTVIKAETTTVESVIATVIKYFN